MNKKRRDAIVHANSLVARAWAIIEEVHEGEEEAYENMPDNLKYSSKGEIAGEAVINLENALSAIEDVDAYLSEISAQ